MNLTLYLNDNITGPRTVTVDAQFVNIDYRLKTCIHRTPFDPYYQNYWAVSEFTTGSRIGKKARTKREATAQAKSLMKSVSDEIIKTAMSDALNKISDIGEYLAFGRTAERDE